MTNHRYAIIFHDILFKGNEAAVSRCALRFEMDSDIRIIGAYG
jgi:hypothetical protein